MSSWFREFSAEIAHDHRELLAARKQRQGKSPWSFETAIERTQEFYLDRFTGYARCGSITGDELSRLLEMVETLGTLEFPEHQP